MVSHERFIVDENGKRIGVLLDIEAYHRLGPPKTAKKA
jgi:hypothetical protein